MTEFASLAGLNAVVTGSSSGIGRAIAIELATAGANVVLHCRQSIEAVKAVANEIHSLGRQSGIAQADIRDAEALPKL
ncbi:MAG: SDR family NAD(P)-dependent oxidoreductase, partial [Planctomycetaceae bacterium]|nr:SDR family NAD(P)-dependent oxidoreductase [Planctomycetaceae bacterium]